MSNRQFNYKSSSGGFNIIPALIFGVIFLVALFFVARFVFNILSYLSIVFLIITLVLDYKIVVNYVKWIFEMMGKNPLVGVALVLLTIFGHPIVSLFLFGKAMLKKKVKEMTQQFEQKTQGEYTEYEEVKTEEAEWVELPPPPVREKTKQTRGGKNEYEDLFD